MKKIFILNARKFNLAGDIVDYGDLKEAIQKKITCENIPLKFVELTDDEIDPDAIMKSDEDTLYFLIYSKTPEALDKVIFATQMFYSYYYETKSTVSLRDVAGATCEKISVDEFVERIKMKIAGERGSFRRLG